eukprot:3401897-Alexandrium_andersonii.AAC.2
MEARGLHLLCGGEPARGALLVIVLVVAVFVLERQRCPWRRCPRWCQRDADALPVDAQRLEVWVSDGRVGGI